MLEIPDVSGTWTRELRQSAAPGATVSIRLILFREQLPDSLLHGQWLEMYISRKFSEQWAILCVTGTVRKAQQASLMLTMYPFVHSAALLPTWEAGMSKSQ